MVLYVLTYDLCCPQRNGTGAHAAIWRRSGMLAGSGQLGSCMNGTMKVLLCLAIIILLLERAGPDSAVTLGLQGCVIGGFPADAHISHTADRQHHLGVQAR